MNTNKSRHREIGPVRQNPIHRLASCSRKCAKIEYYTILQYLSSSVNIPSNSGTTSSSDVATEVER